MLNFEEELEKFQPSLEIEDAEDLIISTDLTDLTDIIKDLVNDKKNN